MTWALTSFSRAPTVETERREARAERRDEMERKASVWEAESALRWLAWAV